MRTIIAALVALVTLVTPALAQVSTSPRVWVVVTDGVVTDMITIGAGDQRGGIAPADGQVWVEATGSSPLPQLGNSATQDGAGAWSFAPSPAQVGAALIAAGVTIASASAPGMNGTYPLDSTSLFNVNTAGFYCQNFGTFPTGLTANEPWQDASGVVHVIPDCPHMISFARAVAKFYGSIVTGQTPPAQPIQIDGQ